MYGYFEYRFFTVASERATFAAEFAVRQRFLEWYPGRVPIERGEGDAIESAVVETTDTWTSSPSFGVATARSGGSSDVHPPTGVAPRTWHGPTRRSTWVASSHGAGIVKPAKRAPVERMPCGAYGIWQRIPRRHRCFEGGAILLGEDARAMVGARDGKLLSATGEVKADDLAIVVTAGPLKEPAVTELPDEHGECVQRAGGGAYVRARTSPDVG